MKEIKITKGYIALVDDEDFEYLNQFSWCANVDCNGRVSVQKRKTKAEPIHTKMSRLILGTINLNILVDHANRDGLNNQRYNLRECTRQQNNCNANSAKNATSKYLGVSLQTVRFKKKTATMGIREYSYTKWRATIGKDYKQVFIGIFKSETEAALAYNEKAKDFHGEFANLNQIPT